MSRTAMGIAALVAAGVTAWTVQRPAGARFERELAWAGRGVWLKADTHVHTRFSDGGHTVDEVVERAAANGCDVVAITDHADRQLTAATPEYHAAIAKARARWPGLVILTGIEWNVPPGRGDDHATVLFPPSMESADLVGEFTRLYDDFDREPLADSAMAEALSWLREKAPSSLEAPLVFLNHPSRRAPTVEAVAIRLAALSAAGPGVFVGAEGAPGHQRATPLGAYAGALMPDDRWDPAIAPPGGAWDRQLAAGRSLWGALATSDFHAEANGDYWPCQFSATWIYASDRSQSAVLAALGAGSFFGVHGDIAREVQLTLTADGLRRAAMAGEVVRLAADASITVELQATIPATDWEGRANRLDVVDLIGISREGAEVLHAGPLVEGRLRFQATVPAGGMTIRARGRRVVEDGPDLLFTTNQVVVR